MTPHGPRLLRELGLVLAAMAALAGLAVGVQKLFFSRAVPAPDVPRSLDEALKPIMLRQIRAENRLVEDPAVTQGMSVIAQRLGAGDTEQAVEILVIDSPLVNAFAVPGRVVCVYTGLMKALSSADELAAILAHEMSHATSRDPLAALARRVGMATLAGILTGGQGATVAQDLLAELVSLRYGRQAEDRADRFAVDLLARSGIDPSSYARALTRIRESGAREPGLMRYLDPHSPIDERIARAEKEAESLSSQSARNLAEIDVDWKSLLRSLPSVLEPAQ